QPDRQQPRIHSGNTGQTGRPGTPTTATPDDQDQLCDTRRLVGGSRLSNRCQIRTDFHSYYFSVRSDGLN
ncbi:MAG TPA: hypothetical protein VF086_09405, partial [Propionibacteriaceae bacterium]